LGSFGGWGEPAEGLVRPLMVVFVAPGIEGGLEFSGAVRVAEPDAFELHGLDDALGDSVAIAPGWAME